MIIKFTPKDIAHLNDMKKQGRRRDHTIRIETLFKVFHEVCRIKRLRRFRAAWFNQSWSGTHQSGGSHSDVSLVLGRGQILNCIKYGNRRGLIKKVSNYRWEFVEL